jgi:hypothetical protein
VTEMRGAVYVTYPAPGRVPNENPAETETEAGVLGRSISLKPASTDNCEPSTENCVPFLTSTKA